MTATADAPVTRVIIPYRPRVEQREIHAALEAHRFAVLVAHRRMGKTVCVVNHLIRSALTCSRPKSQYAYIAPQRNQAKDIAWSYLKHYTDPIPGRAVNETELAITLPNGSRIRIYGADNPDALRGIYLDGVVLDEVAQMRPEVWGEIIRPALADRQGWAVFIGTPKGQNLFHELYQHALISPGWFARLWRADETNIIPEAELVAVREELSSAQYRQEFLCDFSASSDDVLIPISLADAASRRVLTEWDVKGADKVIGVDVARFGSDRSAIAIREGLWCRSVTPYQGLSNDALADRVAAAIRDFQPDATFVDVGGGTGVIDFLRRRGFSISEVNFGGRALKDKKYWDKRAEMWGELRNWLQLGGAIPDDPALRTDLSQPHYGYSDDDSRLKLESKDRIKERGGRSPDLGDALALTFASPVSSAIRVIGDNHDSAIDYLEGI